MSFYLVVKQGDCLSSIATRYGFSDWQTIYNDPANAGLRAKRPDPNILYPGDNLYIPDRDPGEQACQTDARHVFVLNRQPTYINVRVQNPAKEPIKDAYYNLFLGSLKLEGTTDSDGWIRRKIPASAQLGTLFVYPDPDKRDEFIRWEVRLGHLDPLETVSGVKGRLKNLGYWGGEVNNQQGSDYDAAVRQFQRENGLIEDGIVGPKTRSMLEQEHRK